jgi:hypothetical protein
MSAEVVAQSRCSWCVLPKARKGLIVGLMGSFLLHGVALAAISHLGSPEHATSKEARVIYVGEITLIAPKKPPVSANAKEI